MKPEIITAIKAWIGNNLDQCLTADAIAERSGYNVHYFQRQFSKIEGQPLAAYVRRKRVDAAAVALASSNDSVMQIALDHGFIGARAFLLVFRRYYKQSPVAYRKAQRNRASK